MNDPALKQDLFFLVGYLLTSAHGLYGEPHGYGPFRLVDTAGRLLALLNEHFEPDPFLQEMAARIDAERFGTSGEDALKSVLHELSLQYTAELKKRVQQEEDKA